jgi:arginase family enzyme
LPLITTIIQPKNPAKIIDVGDIPNNDQINIAGLHQNAEIFFTQNIKGKFLLIGGTNDIILPIYRSMCFKSPWAIIHIDSGLDCKGSINQSEHSESAYRVLHQEATKNNGRIIHFGALGIRCSKADAKYAESNNGKIYWNSTLHAFKSIPAVYNQQEISTGVGLSLLQIIKELNDVKVLVSFDLCSVKV